MFKELIRIYDYREMLNNSVRKELRARYKGSVLGFLWTFINPLLQLFIYSFVFNIIMRIPPPPGVNYTLMIFVALVPWTCIAATINQSTLVIVANANLLKKIYFPRLILPLSLTVTNFVNMLLTEIIVIAAAIILRAPMTIAYIALPLPLIGVFLLAFSISILLSAVTVYFRDLEHIFSIFTMLWFYLTPIIYSVEYLQQNSSLTPQVLFFYKLNPVYGLTEGIRDIMIFGRFPEWGFLAYSFAFSLILMLIALAVFDKCQRRFAEEI